MSSAFETGRIGLIHTRVCPRRYGHGTRVFRPTLKKGGGGEASLPLGISC